MIHIPNDVKLKILFLGENAEIFCLILNESLRMSFLDPLITSMNFVGVDLPNNFIMNAYDFMILRNLIDVLDIRKPL